MVEKEEIIFLPPLQNCSITTSVWLALVFRYFAGGAPTDLMCKYGVPHAYVFVSVWVVVEAIKNIEEFNIEYPSSKINYELPMLFSRKAK